MIGFVSSLVLYHARNDGVVGGGDARGSDAEEDFEVDPVRCVKCGGGMKLVAVILDDRELDRILTHQGWPTEFPKMQASRAPPGSAQRADAAAFRRNER